MLEYKCPCCHQKTKASEPLGKPHFTEKGVKYLVTCVICLHKTHVRVEPIENIAVKNIHLKTINMN